MSERTLRSVLVLSIIMMCAANLGVAYVYARMYGPDAYNARFSNMILYTVFSVAGLIAQVVAMVCVALAVHRHTARLAPVPHQSKAGLALAVIGAALALSGFGTGSGVNSSSALTLALVTGMASLGLPLFLLGLGLMLLWAPPLGPVPSAAAPAPSLPDRKP